MCVCVRNWDPVSLEHHDPFHPAIRGFADMRVGGLEISDVGVL